MRRAVFIDRDGVICRNRDDHVKNWEEFEFLPGALEALERLAQSKFSIVVITNQAIINRHMVSAEEVENIHKQMVRAIEEAGGRVDLVTYCPHRPDEHCDCRKPQPGLLLKAAVELKLDLSKSYVIGDAETDMQAGRVAGCQRYLVLTGRGRRQLMRCWLHGERGFVVVPSLGAATRSILHRENGYGRRTLLSDWRGGGNS
jgi:histidinol-phosphate phosphatase family protein